MIAGLLGACVAVGVVTFVVAMRPVAPGEIPDPTPPGTGDHSPKLENLTLRLALGWGGGVVTFVVAMRPVAPGEIPAPTPPGTGDHSPKLENLTLRLALGLSVGLIVGLVTRWPMAALLVGAAGFMAPSVVGGGAARKAKLDRIDAMAGWAEMLRDTMAGSGGLEQSILDPPP